MENLKTGEMVIIIIIILVILGIRNVLSPKRNIEFVEVDTNPLKNAHVSKNISNRRNPVSDMYQNLSIQQRCTIMNLLFFFQGFSMGRSNAEEANKIVFFMADSLAVTILQAMSYAETYNNDADRLICNLKTINDRVVLDSVLYNCFGLVKISGQDDGFEVLMEIFSELGYTQATIKKTIEKIEALGRLFNS